MNISFTLKRLNKGAKKLAADFNLFQFQKDTSTLCNIQFVSLICSVWVWMRSYWRIGQNFICINFSAGCVKVTKRIDKINSHHFRPNLRVINKIMFIKTKLKTIQSSGFIECVISCKSMVSKHFRSNLPDESNCTVWIISLTNGFM